MKPYIHKAQFYETDKMGIIHHSNYIRWMESARIDYMNQMGASYHSLEEAGVGSPLLSVSCEYKSMVFFDDIVSIETKILSYNGIKIRIGYTMTNETTGKLCTTGETNHCFLNMQGQPVSLKKSYPQFHEAFMRSMEA